MFGEMFVYLAFYCILHHHEDSGGVMKPPVKADDIGMPVPLVEQGRAILDGDLPEMLHHLVFSI